MTNVFPDDVKINEIAPQTKAQWRVTRSRFSRPLLSSFHRSREMLRVASQGLLLLLPFHIQKARSDGRARALIFQTPQKG